MVIAILILTKIGILGGNLVNVSTAQGLAFLFAGVPIGVVGIVSGYTQGRAAAAGMQLISKKDGALGNAIISAVMVETYAILAFIISFLMYNGVQIG